MIIVGDCLVSEDIIEKPFACNVSACKGACCIEGDAGAPLLEEELGELEKVYPLTKKYLSDKNIKALEPNLLFSYFW